MYYVNFLNFETDIRKIIPAEILPDSLAGGIARVSNLKNSKVVTSPSGKKVVLSQAGEIDATHYLDSQTGSVFAIDHLSLVRFYLICFLHCVYLIVIYSTLCII